MRELGEKVDRQMREIAKLKGGNRWRKHEPLSDSRKDGNYGRRYGSRGDRIEISGERSRQENDGRDWRKRVEKRSSGDVIYIPHMRRDHKLGVELGSSKEDVLSCEKSEVVEESSKEEKLLEAKEEEGCKKRGNPLIYMNLQLIPLTFKYFCV
ncbi:hypothetical protein M9H77_07382 [Catharanthus roseus]|uniref:Uncharacterized protein n=1 Tax=Catharanthus roseus TaxID=4058 RepID=A0ACC0BUS3_CATRO|nr:hypothetical protein M9H77_07382 [Catharanthus roseus]